MYDIFDAHAHIYPEKIARKASKAIGDFYSIPMQFDGTPETLLTLGDKYGVKRFLVHSVATVEHQVRSINDFLIEQARAHADKFTGFATMHPDFANPADELARVKALGLKGVKLHPDFQKFEISDPKMDTAYEAMQALNLPVLFHTGDKRYSWSSPRHIPVITRKFPQLKIICAHFGGYSEWAEADIYLKHESVWVDTSSSMFMLSDDEARARIRAFGEDRVLFGSDYPMWNVGDEIQNILRLDLGEQTTRKIFYDNMAALLGEV